MRGVGIDVTTYRSPALDLPGAVADESLDAGVAAHYGDPFREQRELLAGRAAVDLSHRDVVRISGPDRLSWLHQLTTQYFTGLAPMQPVSALILDAAGRVEHAFEGVDDGSAMWLHTEPGAAGPLIDYLMKMKFWSDVEVTDVTAEYAIVHERVGTAGEQLARVSDGERDVFLPREQLTEYLRHAGGVAGVWAAEALRVAEGRPRLGVDTDDKSIPNELGWLGTAVNLDKGCYRGQETVARVHTLGRPPRRLTLLHLDGTEERLPETGSSLLLPGADDPESDRPARPLGRVGSSARHYEYGPIALGLVKRSTPVDQELRADGIPAMQEVIVDPDVGLHVRHRLT